MKPLFKAGAYLTALLHSVYVPTTLLFVLRPDPGALALANFGVCATGITVGFLIDYCPLTFIEKWFRRRYNPLWVFSGGWVQYYSRLALAAIGKFFHGIRIHIHN